MSSIDFSDTIRSDKSCSDESSNDRESEVSSIYELDDLPYCSPNKDSENDDDIVEMDFSLFSMENSDETQILEVTNENLLPSEQCDDQQEAIGEGYGWCKCEKCTPCTGKEAVCCQDKLELSELVHDGQCVTDQSFFQAQLLSEDGLQYNRFIIASLIQDATSRDKFLRRPFDNTLKRHICYRNFVAFTNGGQPMGRNNRMVLPRCVVNKIREAYPDPHDNYSGYRDPVVQ